jgi:PhzF family phenazine biosynthesis protein
VSEPTLERLAAFTDDPAGGNPAGVWIGDELPDPAAMQAVAAEVGYSETAFLAPDGGVDRWTVRYFAPAQEVDFCGHATIAAGVALGRRLGDRTYLMATPAGEVPVEVRHTDDGVLATLTSVPPQRRDLDAGLLDAALAALRWTRADLADDLVPDLAFAGVWHLVLPVRSRAVLASLDYGFEELRTVMADAGLTTVQVVWREHPGLFHARDPFPVGGVVEDPATGAAAAALGGWLRHHGYAAPPADVVVLQGEDLGRPSRLLVHVPVEGGIRVSGSAAVIDGQ